MHRKKFQTLEATISVDLTANFVCNALEALSVCVDIIRNDPALRNDQIALARFEPYY